MLESELFTQVQVLHQMILDNYNRMEWCVKASWPADRGAIIKVVMSLENALDPGGTMKQSELKDLRLDCLVAMLPLRQPDGKPFSLLSTKDLLLAELYGLLSWLEQNGGATKAIQEIATDTAAWIIKLHKQFQPIVRPRP